LLAQTVSGRRFAANALLKTKQLFVMQKTIPKYNSLMSHMQVQTVSVQRFAANVLLKTKTDVPYE